MEEKVVELVQALNPFLGFLGFWVLGLAKTHVETSLVGHLLEEVWGPGREAGVGAAGAVEDLKREVVYNTMFHVPWRCELVRGEGGGF